MAGANLDPLSQGLFTGLQAGGNILQFQEQRDARADLRARQDRAEARQSTQDELGTYLKGLDAVTKNPELAPAINQLFARAGLAPLDEELVANGPRTRQAVADLATAAGTGSLDAIPPDRLPAVLKVASSQPHLSKTWETLVTRSLEERSRQGFIQNRDTHLAGGMPPDQAHRESLLQTKGALDIPKITAAGPPQPNYQQADERSLQPRIQQVLGMLDRGAISERQAATELEAMGPAGRAVLASHPTLKAFGARLDAGGTVLGGLDPYRDQGGGAAPAAPANISDFSPYRSPLGVDIGLTGPPDMPPGAPAMLGPTGATGNLSVLSSVERAKAEGRQTDETLADKQRARDIAERNARANESRAASAARNAAGRAPGGVKPTGAPVRAADGLYYQRFTDGSVKQMTDEAGQPLAVPKPPEKMLDVLIRGGIEGASGGGPGRPALPGRRVPTPAEAGADVEATRRGAPPPSGTPATASLAAAKPPAQQTAAAVQAEAMRIQAAAKKRGVPMTPAQIADAMQALGWDVTK